MQIPLLILALYVKSKQHTGIVVNVKNMTSIIMSIDDNFQNDNNNNRSLSVQDCPEQHALDPFVCQSMGSGLDVVRDCCQPLKPSWAA